MSNVFIDSNILIYSQDAASSNYKRSMQILKGILESGGSIVITPFVLNETHYFFIKAVGIEKGAEAITKILKIPNLKLVDLILTTNDIKSILRISKKYKLKTFDSFHTYYCKKLQIKKIATLDTDFNKILWLKTIN